MSRMDKYRSKFKSCNHDWNIHVDAGDRIQTSSGNSEFICEKCSTIITLSEKLALQSYDALKESLKIQENHTKNGMIANWLTFLLVLIAFLTLAFGNGIIKKSELINKDISETHNSLPENITSNH